VRQGPHYLRGHVSQRHRYLNTEPFIHKNLMPQISLQDIHDQRTRDLMRGLLDRSTKPPGADATLSRLLSTVQKSDLFAFDWLLRKNKLYQHVEVLPEFPPHAPFNDNRGLSLVPTGILALDYVSLRIAENSGRICDAFEMIHSLNAAIHADNHELIARTIGQIVEVSGHSLTLARKAAFVIGYYPKDSVAHKACVDLVSAYGVNGKNYGMMVTIDAIGAEFNYLDLKYRFRRFATLERDAAITRKVSELCFAPLAATKDDLIALVSAYYEISLLDAAVALLSHQDQGIAEVVVPTSVLNVWRNLASQPATVFSCLNKDDSYVDLWAFRAAPAFLEYASFRRMRYALQDLYTLPEGGGRTNPSAGHYAALFFEGVDRVSDVVPPAEHDLVATPEKFDRETAGTLSRSCALVWVCERDADFSDVSTEDMALLMGQTFEIDRLINTRLLRRAVTTTSNPFVKLILQTLLRAQSSATRDSFNFKDLFQRYVRDHHHGDILQFMEMVKSLDKKIVNYFVNLLDETMLSQMAFLMESSEAIYDTRARLLEWYADIAQDPLAQGKAKQLRLDRKIAAARGAINETRLNIDSVRFRQWIEQNKLSDFSDFIRQAQLNLPPISDLTDSSKKATQFLAAHREPAKLALLALVSCYEEFCRNPDYGIASFLGRRIRHGTLRGTLLNGLPDGSDPEFPQSLLAQYQVWIKDFSTSIDALAGRLYFRSKSAHKDGLLSAEIDSEQKWQMCLICLTRIYAQAQQDHGVIFAPLLIEQFCWLAFELELAKAQTSIGEARAKWGTLKLRYSPTDPKATIFEKSTNITLGDHFATVMSWFRKPPNISPVAELAHVIQVVIGEAREEYATFNPVVGFNGDRDLQLSGATYYVVYDALTIAVRNAAKHGLHPGKVSIDAKVTDLEAGKTLEIAVTSQLKSCDGITDVLTRIESAGSAGVVDADIVEGLSGMRKLKKMEHERNILRFTPSAGAENPNSLRMSIVFAFKGLVE
jgi:hypothetical protein